MAECWFVLLRFWLRVDGVLVRLREVRFCGKFTGCALPFSYTWSSEMRTRLAYMSCHCSIAQSTAV